MRVFLSTSIDEAISLLNQVKYCGYRWEYNEIKNMGEGVTLNGSVSKHLDESEVLLIAAFFANLGSGELIANIPHFVDRYGTDLEYVRPYSAEYMRRKGL